MLTAYPFEDGSFLEWSDGIDANEAQIALQKCFVDASINLNVNKFKHYTNHVADDIANSRAAKVQTIDECPHIGHFRVNGNALYFVLTACNVDVNLSVSATKIRYPIISGCASFGSYTLILSSEGVCEFCKDISVYPPPSTVSSSPRWRERGFWLPLVGHCVTSRPQDIMSINVYDGINNVPYIENGVAKETTSLDVIVDCIENNTAIPNYSINGDVVIEPGNNMTFTKSENVTGFALNAVAGSGLGIVECTCTNNDSSSAINGSPIFDSDDGQARIFTDTCYDIEPQQSYTSENGVQHGVLKLHGKCTACCQCSMYESIVNDRLVILANEINSLKDKLDLMKIKYERTVKNFNTRINELTMDDIKVSVTGMTDRSISRVSFTAVVQNCGFVPAVIESPFMQVHGRSMLKPECSKEPGYVKWFPSWLDGWYNNIYYSGIDLESEMETATYENEQGQVITENWKDVLIGKDRIIYTGYVYDDPNSLALKAWRGITLYPGKSMIFMVRSKVDDSLRQDNYYINWEKDYTSYFKCVFGCSIADATKGELVYPMYLDAQGSYQRVGISRPHEIGSLRVPGFITYEQRD